MPRTQLFLSPWPHPLNSQRAAFLANCGHGVGARGLQLSPNKGCRTANGRLQSDGDCASVLKTAKCANALFSEKGPRLGEHEYTTEFATVLQVFEQWVHLPTWRVWLRNGQMSPKTHKKLTSTEWRGSMLWSRFRREGELQWLDNTITRPTAATKVRSHLGSSHPLLERDTTAAESVCRERFSSFARATVAIPVVVSAKFGRLTALQKPNGGVRGKTVVSSIPPNGEKVGSMVMLLCPSCSRWDNKRVFARSRGA